MQPPATHRLHRAELLLGRPTLDRLAAANVILFGVGGVGSWCAEALIRTGIRRLTIVDSDVVCPTNINRQRQATVETIGRSKVDEMRARLLEIDPEAEITAIKMLYTAETCDSFDLARYDYVLDAIDTLQNKVLLLRRALAAGVTVYASMGAAAKLDPTRIRIAPIGKTQHCALARAVRRELRHAGETGDSPCVYSEEPPAENRGRTFCGSGTCACPDPEERNLCLSKAKINGSLVHVTAPFGFALAGLVIQDLARQDAAPEQPPA